MSAPRNHALNSVIELSRWHVTPVNTINIINSAYRGGIVFIANSMYQAR